MVVEQDGKPLMEADRQVNDLIAKVIYRFLPKLALCSGFRCFIILQFIFKDIARLLQVKKSILFLFRLMAL